MNPHARPCPSPVTKSANVFLPVLALLAAFLLGIGAEPVRAQAPLEIDQAPALTRAEVVLGGTQVTGNLSGRAGLDLELLAASGKVKGGLRG